MGSITLGSNGHTSPLQQIDASFHNAQCEDSAIELVYRTQPKWRDAPGKLEVVKFTDGITNTVKIPTILLLLKHVLILTLLLSYSRSPNIFLACLQMRSNEILSSCALMATIRTS